MIVTGATFSTSAFAVESTAAVFGADSTAGVFAVDSIVGAFTGSTAGFLPIEASAGDVLAAAAGADAFEMAVSFASGRAATGTLSSGAFAASGAATLASFARCDSLGAAISAAAATTQATPRMIARELMAHGKRVECFAPAGFVNRPDRRGCFVFSTPSDIFFSESLWSFRSPLSK